MPRKLRDFSESGVYHVISRGVNREKIFYDDSDYNKFINTLYRYREECHFDLYAYTLMNNHIHLLIRTTDYTLGDIMKKIMVSYVYWFNNRYDRIGHLFQDRFKSESVEDDTYFLTVFRYIFQNPVKAKLVDRASEYKWNNYLHYFNNEKLIEFPELDYVLKIMSDNISSARDKMRNFVDSENKDLCLDIFDEIKYSDSDAKIIIESICNIEDAQDLKLLSNEEKKAYICELRFTYGLSIRQIQNLTGIGRGYIQRCNK